MKHTFTLEKTEKNIILLFAPNGGDLHSFDKEIFPEIQTIRGGVQFHIQLKEVKLRQDILLNV